jgi:hypothetical protein
VRLARHLTDRDRQIAEDCFEHRVLTTEQLRRLHFTREQGARRRLGKLRQLRVLDSFQPVLKRGAGSSPNHWILDTAGAYVVAAVRGLEQDRLPWTRQPPEAVANSATLDHRRDTNEFATQLIEAVRAAGGIVPTWHGERGARELLGGIVIPDSYLAIEQPGCPPLHLLLELDRGTEDGRRLLTKARRYAKAIPRSKLLRANVLVLVLVPSMRRARTAAATLARGPWPIAVEPWTPGGEPPHAIVQRAGCSLPDLSSGKANSS